jgi:hypothetical protein
VGNAKKWRRKKMAKLEKALEVRPDYGLGEGDPAIVRWELDQALLQQCPSGSPT